MQEQEHPGPQPFAQEIRGVVEQASPELGLVQTPDDIEDLAFTILDRVPEAVELLDDIERARNAGQDETHLVRRRARMAHDVMVELSLVTGIEIEERDHETQKTAYKTQLKDRLDGIDSTVADQDLLINLGILKPVDVNGETKYRFTFPTTLFPPYIKEQWDSYLRMVEQQEEATKDLQHGVISQQEFNAYDKIRTRAHNTVSASVGEILEFPDWDLESYRRLVAKMVDEKFGEPMGEMAQYARLFRERKEKAKVAHMPEIHKALGRQATEANLGDLLPTRNNQRNKAS